MTGFSTDNSPTERLKETIRSSRRAVVFSGAGISTESGIPDYRSPGGIWTRFRPIDFQEFIASEEARREYWRRKFDTHEAVMQAKPNSGHLAIAELVRLRKVAVVVTQNVDGLHQASGIPRAQVIELHGNTTYAHCLSCGKEYELEPIREAFLADQSLPECAACGGLVKTATISFEQAIPQEAMRRATAEAMACDLFLAIGSEELRMQREEVTQKIIAAKMAKGLKWADVAATVGRSKNGRRRRCSAKCR